MKGDTQMQRVLLGRLIPPAKPESSLQSFYLPEGSLSEQARAVIQAVGRESCPPPMLMSYCLQLALV